MPHRHNVAGVNLLLVIAFVSATAANVIGIGNALAARDNCRRIALHSDRTRALLQRSLDPVERGELDGDYKQLYGTTLVDVDGKKVPLWMARKQQQIDRAKREIAEFAEIDCTITIVRWIKGE